jgi:predicted nucleic acid-binding protein
LVAVCQVYGMTQVVTFNSQHFARLASFVPNLNVVDPRSIQP